MNVRGSMLEGFPLARRALAIIGSTLKYEITTIKLEVVGLSRRKMLKVSISIMFINTHGLSHAPMYTYAFLTTKGTLFFVSRLLGPRVCGRQENKTKKKLTEHERVQFLGTTEHEMMPHTHATRQKPHTEHERVQF